MKIKLSKSQWEKIGKKTGWVKESQIQIGGPVDQLVGIFNNVSQQILAQSLLEIDPDIPEKILHHVESLRLKQRLKQRQELQKQVLGSLPCIFDNSLMAKG